MLEEINFLFLKKHISKQYFAVETVFYIFLKNYLKIILLYFKKF